MQGLVVTRMRIAVVAVLLALSGTAFLLWRQMPRPEKMAPGKFPEQLVYARTNDDIVDSGAIFTAPKDSEKPIAVIWIHGWGVNFYQPTYGAIGRALAERGYTTIAGNTRMHDLGNVLAWRRDKRIRGGGYWGIASEEVRDIAAWIDFAQERGFERGVLAGHSAGWSAVRGYQADIQAPRVAGVVFAYGAVGAETRRPDSEQLAEATPITAAVRPHDFVRRPHPS